MSYTVIRGRGTRNGSSASQPAGPSVAQIREVQTVVGAPIDFGSWLKNAMPGSALTTRFAT